MISSKVISCLPKCSSRGSSGFGILLANYAAFVIGLIPPLKQVFFGEGAALAFVANSVEILGQPAVGIVTLVISGTLGKVSTNYR